MNKFSSVFDVPLVLVLLAGPLLVRVKGQICSESLGPCGGVDCCARCAFKHPGGQGSCDISNTCKCFYACAGVPKKTCNISLGIYATGCDNEKCDFDCHSKYPGAQDGHGFCYSISPYVSCRCLYLCDG